MNYIIVDDKTKAEIVFRFFQTKENTVKEISKAVGISIYIVDRVLSDYMKNKDYFYIYESKMNFENN